ncbi:MAG: hypothetical protein ACK5XB_15700 [Rhodospirillales bacterium]
MNAMFPTLSGDKSGQIFVHFFAGNEFARTASGQQFGEGGPLHVVGFHLPAQTLDALLQNRTHALKATGFDKVLGEGMLIVGQRNRRFYGHGHSLGKTQ